MEIGPNPSPNNMIKSSRTAIKWTFFFGQQSQYDSATPSDKL